MFLLKKHFQISPVHIFLSGSGGTGKSHSVKTIYEVVSTELLYHSKEPDKPCVLLLRHLTLNLWRMFQFAELTEVMRQRSDKKFIDLLKKYRLEM